MHRSDKKNRRILNTIHRLRSQQPPQEEEVKVIATLPSERIRPEPPVPITFERDAFLTWWSRQLKWYPTPEEGLKSLGWKAMAKGQGPAHEKGLATGLKLAYKRTEHGRFHWSLVT